MTTPNDNGYIALMAVIVLSAVALAGSVGMLTTGTDNQRAIYANQLASQARQHATACAEEALQIINENRTFLGSGSYNSGGRTCTYTVADGGSSTRVIDVNSSVSSTVYKLKVYGTIGASNISVTSWQEVGT